ncbi:hypothetical protein ABTZ93_38475 [Streptomyces sp. NPDC097941]|uniref:hypothetical protein n=1 Tax=Streptomyces sp. NPDC097941 TaxID=3155685 RepID=UPI003320FB49
MRPPVTLISQNRSAGGPPYRTVKGRPSSANARLCPGGAASASGSGWTSSAKPLVDLDGLVLDLGVQRALAVVVQRPVGGPARAPGVDGRAAAAHPHHGPGSGVLGAELS